MSTGLSDYQTESLQNSETGSLDSNEPYKVIVYPFDKYEIKVRISEDNTFLGIDEIRINKNFLNYRQKIQTKGYHDVEDYYNE